MTRTELNKFQAVLNTKHVELARATGRRDGIAIERTPDVLDEIQLAGERELTTRSLERESKLLRDVRAALDRIEEGVYGTCFECDEEISSKRLRAVPWATLCITCQEQTDGSPRRNFGYEETFLRDAA
jgi:RNA polymerase-binding transcription factor